MSQLDGPYYVLIIVAALVAGAFVGPAYGWAVTSGLIYGALRIGG